MLVMRVYIVWVKTWWSRYTKIAKQNVSQVFHGKALPTNYTRKPAIITFRIPVMCFARGLLRGITSHEIHLIFNESLSLRTLSHTQPL